MREIYEQRNAILIDPIEYIQRFFKIRSKGRTVIRFELNPIQLSYMVHRSNNGTPGKGQRDLILKARQHGFSTVKLAEFFHDTITHRSTTTMIVGHDEEAMELMLMACRLMYAGLPMRLKPGIQYDSKSQMYFPELNSRISIMTYRMVKARSQTINNLLMTELAFWEGRKVGDLIAGITESVPLDGNIAIESTPNGMKGFFFEEATKAKKGKSAYKLFTYPWFVNGEYRIQKGKWNMVPKTIRDEGDDLVMDALERRLAERFNVDEAQLMWRRYKMLSFGDLRVSDNGIRSSRRFAQEYECSFVQSGRPVFDSAYLVPKVKFEKPRPEAKYIMGADTAEGVEDGNFNVLYILELETGKVVDKVRNLAKPGDFALMIHKKGMEYGGLIGVEVNNTGHAVLLKLVELWAKEYDNNGAVPYRIYSEKKRYGWQTGEGNRKILFIELEEGLRQGDIQLAEEDEEGIEELIACQYNARMKEEAPEGMNDDSVLALGIAWQMRKYYQFYFKPEQKDQGVGVRTF